MVQRATLATPPRTVAVSRTPGAALRMVGNETAKNLNILWHRRAVVLVELALAVILYLGVQYLIGGGRFIDALLPATLIGFLVYIVAYLLLVKVVSGILEEMNTGTLEQMHLSPLPPWLLSVGLVTAVMVEGVLVAGLVGGALAIGLGIEFPGLSWAVLLPAVLTLLDIAGFALLMGRIALTVASIGAINHVIYGLIGMINGSYVPVYAYPDWLQVVAKLVPSTLGIDVMRRMLIEDSSLASTWADHSLQWALLHTVVMLLLGWTVYQRQIRRGLREGGLGPR